MPCEEHVSSAALPVVTIQQNNDGRRKDGSESDTNNQPNVGNGCEKTMTILVYNIAMMLNSVSIDHLKLLSANSTE